jgi:hypothetical protein
MGLLIETALALPDYWCVQNGVDAGATNPWHFHIQVFQDQVPLHHSPGTILCETPFKTEKVEYPATVYRFSAPCSQSKSFKDALVRKEKALHQSDPQLRLNTLVIHHQNTLFVYWVIRHLTCRTDRYKTGQPGYAEAAGVICAITPEAYETWKQKGWGLYSQLMGEIALRKRLEAGVRNILCNF